MRHFNEAEEQTCWVDVLQGNENVGELKFQVEMHSVAMSPATSQESDTAETLATAVTFDAVNGDLGG